MHINLVGKAKNLAWGCEPMIQRGFEALGQRVTFANLSDKALATLGPANLNVILQGYGLSMVAIHRLREASRAPAILWHAEVMSPTWPTDDPVVLAKAEQLSRNASAYDLVVHHCASALETVKALGAKQVAWVPISGVDPQVHRRLEIVKELDVLIYGWQSARRLRLVQDTLACLPQGVSYAWPDASSGQIYGESLIRAINSARCVLNIHFSPTANTETRLWESIGCGTPCVSERVSMPDLFPHGVRYGDTPEELAREIKSILDMDAQTYMDFCNVGYQFVHESQSYKQRCQEFLEAISKEFTL